METPVLTPMQQAIKQFEDLKETAPTFKDQVFLDGVLAVLEQYLLKEQEAITKAYRDGYIEGSSENEYTSTLITEYFNRTYKEHGK
jgi:hypothetical protein